jgi:hypothetical protein
MPKNRGISFGDVRQMALALPGVEEGTSYGTPAFKLRKKMLLRLREEGDVIVLKLADDALRDVLMQSQPDVFFITDHYRGYPAVLVRLPQVYPAELRELIQTAWREAASQKQLAEYEAAFSGATRCPRS